MFHPDFIGWIPSIWSTLSTALAMDEATSAIGRQWASHEMHLYTKKIGLTCKTCSADVLWKSESMFLPAKDAQELTGFFSGLIGCICSSEDNVESICWLRSFNPLAIPNWLATVQCAVKGWKASELMTFGMVLDSALLVLFTFAVSLNVTGSRIVCLIVLPLSLTYTKHIKIKKKVCMRIKIQ